MAALMRSTRTQRFRLRFGIFCGLIVFLWQCLLPWWCSDGDPLAYSPPSRSRLDELLSQANTRLEELQAGYDRNSIFNALNIDLGPSVSFADYTASLEHAANDVFAFASTSRRVPLRVRRVVQSARSASILHSSAAAFNDTSEASSVVGMPQKIGTTIRNVSEMPFQFAAWKTFNPNWDITLYDDVTMRDWLNARLTIPGAFGGLPTTLLEIYDRMPRPILKSDFFRYLLVFFDGGLYTDSDTSCIHAIAEWGHKGTTQDWTDPTMLQLTNQAQALSTTPPPTPINEGAPALIISLESSVDTATFAWHDQANSGGQVVQWTFGGKPGHPSSWIRFNGSSRSHAASKRCEPTGTTARGWTTRLCSNGRDPRSGARPCGDISGPGGVLIFDDSTGSRIRCVLAMCSSFRIPPFKRPFRNWTSNSRSRPVFGMVPWGSYAGVHLRSWSRKWMRYHRRRPSRLRPSDES